MSASIFFWFGVINYGKTIGHFGRAVKKAHDQADLPGKVRRYAVRERDRRGQFGGVVRHIKAACEGELVKKYARFVLTLEDGEVVYTENKNPIANIIAVLGPVSVDGVLVREAILLEVGLSRARPYGNAEKEEFRAKGMVWFLKPRTRARALSTVEQQRIHPWIISLIEEETIRVRATWEPKSRGEQRAWSARRKKMCFFENGIHFSVSRDDAWLHDDMMRRAGRRRGHTPQFPTLPHGMIRYAGKGKTHGSGSSLFEHKFKKEYREQHDI